MKKEINLTTSNLYEAGYGDEHPLLQYYVLLFNTIPSKYNNTTKLYSEEIIEYFLNNGFKKESVFENFSRRSIDGTKTLFLLNEEKKIFVEIRTSHSDKSKIQFNLSFIYNIKDGEITEQIDLESHCVRYIIPKKKSNINLIKSENGMLDIEEFDLTIEDMDMELNYGKDFLKVDEKILEKLNEKNGKGIVLLHGDPGTGKSTYLKYLTKQIVDKDVLFIPPSMVEILSEPSIIPFLMEHKNSILIIEDAERVISDRQSHTSSSSGVSNILNLTDGILGDCLSIQIVATFNMNKDKIDTALLRKGRLIAEHKFKKLSINESNKLLESLNKNYITNKEMALSDIYYIDQEEFKVKLDEKIGFK